MKKFLMVVVMGLMVMAAGAQAQDNEYTKFRKGAEYYFFHYNDTDTLLAQNSYLVPLNPFIITSAIDSTASVGTIVDLHGYKLLAVRFPSTFTGATVTIQTSYDSTNFKTVQYDGADVSLTASDGKQCGIKPVEVNQLLRYIRIVSATAEADDRVIEIVVGRFY